MAEKKFFVDINLQGSALKNAKIGTNSGIGSTEGAFGYDSSAHRLQYFDGTATKEVANLSDIAAVTGGLIFQGGFDPTTNTPDISSGFFSRGWFVVAETAGTFLGESVQVGDSIVAKVDNAGATLSDWLILQGNVVIATDSVDGISRLATQTEANDGTEGGAVVITPATLQGKIDAQITPEISSKVSKSGDTMSGELNMGNSNIANVNALLVRVLVDQNEDGSDILLGTNLDGNGSTIVNLPAPTNGGDAANKTYVDGAASTAQANAEATASADATTKANAAQDAAEAYADSLAPNYDAAGAAAQALTDANAHTDTGLANKLNLAGGTMSGIIDMGGNNVENINTAKVGNLETSSPNPSNPINLNSNIYGNGSVGLGNIQFVSGLTDPTNGGDATNKTYVDVAASTAEANANAYADSLAPNYDAAGSAAAAQSNAQSFATSAANTAESNANDYTDTEIAATRYSANIQTTDWTVFGGDPANGYIATITHNLNCYYPVIQLNDDNTGYAVEMATQYNNLNETNIFSNFIPSGLIVATLIKAAV